LSACHRDTIVHLSLKRSQGLLTHTADDGKRFVVRADEKLSAFLEMQRAIHQFAVSLLS
jgi:hypothetical protein